MELTQDYLKSILHYNQYTGVFTWLPRPREMFPSECSQKTWNTRYAGTVAGSKDKDGYVQIRYSGAMLKAHRLVFLYMQGSYPEHQVDHINGVHADNRWRNLRAVTQHENMRNTPRPTTNKSGYAGVRWHNTHKTWQAHIRGIGGAHTHLGTFTNMEDAIAARKAAEILYGYHPNHGRAR